MTVYEIITMIIAILAFLFSIPSFILTIKNIISQQIKFDFTLDKKHSIRPQHNNSHGFAATYTLSNRQVDFTIKKIEAVYNKKTYEVFKETPSSQSIFENIAINKNSIQKLRLFFVLDEPIKEAFVFRFYTNIKVIEKTLTP